METPDIFDQPPGPERVPPQPVGSVAALEQECQDLRTLFHATFVAVLFLAVAVNVFIFKQMRLVQQQLNEQSPLITRQLVDFRKNRHAEVSQFMALLQGYGAGHRDFQTNILDRYRALLPQYFNTTVPIQPVAPLLAPATNSLAPRLPGR